MSTERHPVVQSLVLLFVGLLISGPAPAKSWQHETGTLTLSQTPERIVALNWAATEALLLLGITPVGVADRDGYGYWVKEPALPDEDVANVGTRVAPSLEAIAQLEPDLIVTSTEMAPAANLLERIAPTYVVSVYKEGATPFEKARQMLLTLGEIVGREERARQVLTDLKRTLARQREKLENAGLSKRPVALISFLDQRHVRIYTRNGLFQKALDGLGLDNAWNAEGSYWGFSVIGLEAMANVTDARLVALGPFLPGLSDSLANSPFWTYLPPVQREQVYQIPPAWPFGGVHAVKRLATSLTEALLEGGSNNVQ